MKSEFYKEIFKECITDFDFVSEYLNMDADFSKRDYKSLLKEKVTNSEFQKEAKNTFIGYTIINKDGGLYINKSDSDFIFSFFLKFNSNIFEPYYTIYFREVNFASLINEPYLTSGTSICRYLLNEAEYPLKAKIFSNTSELIHLAKNEVAFFEKIGNKFLDKIKERT